MYKRSPHLLLSKVTMEESPGKSPAPPEKPNEAPAPGSEQASSETGPASQPVDVADESAARRLLRMLEALEDHEDVQNVWSNFDISEALMAKLASA